MKNEHKERPIIQDVEDEIREVRENENIRKAISYEEFIEQQKENKLILEKKLKK